MRLFLTILLPLLAPTLIYLGWLAFRVRSGSPAPISHPWIWLAGTGVVFLALVLGAWALSDGAAPNAHYVPAHLENGRVVEGVTVPDGE